MINTILGTKSNMSTVFNRLGQQVPVTAVVAQPNIIIGKKEGKLILGLGKKKRSKKTDNAYVKIAHFTPRYIKEIILQTPQENSQSVQQADKQLNLGEKVTISIFEPGDEVKITGTTKGKGFAGSVKRWGFAGGPKTHGQSDRHRAPGSIGAGTTPGRVYKGKKMAGHMGNAKLTVKGLEVIEVDENKNILLVKGAVPGPKNGFLIIEKIGKVKSYTPPPPPSEEKQAEKEARVEESETKGTDNSQQAAPEDGKEGQNAEK